ncbi:MAG: cell wall-active antibiotics response protein [Vallitalea sp.]|jgi:hypothetical protein|nr:cell wall-active antibiotics response protein [Vallitalea sp.]MCT4597728.1 cell wall-active antibiotics response protein [Vallitalea sp.]
MKKRNLFGIFVIAIGVIILLDRLGIIVTDDILSTYWPVGLIAIGLINITDKHSSKTFAVILLLVGVVFQLKELNVTVFNNIDITEFIFPVIIIIIGAWLLIPKTSKNLRKNTISTSSIDNMSMFSGSDIINDSENFKGGHLTAAFGGIDVDLRNANISSNEPAIIDSFVAFGGIEIKVPIDWKVQVKGIPLFGGWSNKTDRNIINADKVLIVKCFVLFGGLEIKN